MLNYHPIIVSLGGTLSTSRTDLFELWKAVMEKEIWSAMLPPLSVSPLRARARFFAI